MIKPTYLTFNHNNYHWKKGIDYRANPELYKVGKGEQGVLICEPYKSELGKHWRFKTPEAAEISSTKIYSMFLQYLKDGEFIGADMARKYLQMGFTRARRYANYKGGRKYDADNNYNQLARGTGEKNKAISANIFYKKWQEAESNPIYKELKILWKKKLG